MRVLAPAVLLSTLGALACATRAAPPAQRSHDARFGYLAGDAVPLDPAATCGRWSQTVVSRDAYAGTHTSFPEASPDASCFTPVTHAGRTVAVGHIPEGCAVPSDPQRARMLALAAQLETPGSTEGEELFRCGLTPAQRAAAARHNAAVLRSAASMPAAYPYSAIVVPGYGDSLQAKTSIVSWLPGDACHGVDTEDALRMGAMVPRARRASDAWQGGAAPIVIVSGGAVHSPLVEAFAMLYLLQCDASAPAPFVLVEPCANHTHTNLRDAGRWIVAMGARTAYLVTDDAFQADYFQDWTALSLIAGSVDARSLRDWGYLVGSWRQASVGIEAGFWFTPYRFWAEPRDGLGSLTCVMAGPP